MNHAEAGSWPQSIRHGRVIGLAALSGIAVLLILLIGQRLANEHYMETGLGRAETVLRLTANALDADLARFEVVPELIADFDLIHEIASDPQNPALIAEANHWLAAQNADVGSSDIYLILPNGQTIAASNYLNELSFIGENFSYRPYFTQAMQGKSGRFYGVGTTSGVRGYFFSAPVWDAMGQIIAVVAVKIGVDRIEEGWRGGEYQVMVSDPEGLIFLSSNHGWLYQSLFPLSDWRISRSMEIRRYSDMALRELPLTRLSEHGTPILRIADDGGTRDYILASEAMPEAGWTVHVLLDSTELRSEARFAVLSLAVLVFAALVALALLYQRRARIAERLEMQRFATIELERRVQERTSDLARVNVQLEQEISERRATEAELIAAQASLVQTGKLAALGQMSASLSHEINQPLAAARNYADSAAILIERGDYARARDNIAQILTLVDRMAAIGKHLRQAAQKPEDRLAAVDLAGLLNETRVIVETRLNRAKVVLECDIPASLPALKAGPTRLQQVLVNLISNAADAAESSQHRRIILTARQQGDRIAITVRDFGAGVPDGLIARIFDPFFTTKSGGGGLGLGLSISANIVRDLGGEISCRNLNPGAEFTVLLHQASPP